MKNLLITFFFTSLSLAAAAQLDEQYFGRYTDKMDLTGIEIYELEDEGLEDYCFMVTKNRYNEIGESVYTEIGFARCKQENGEYVAEIESDEANLWLVFETDQFGNRTVTAHEKDKPAESFFYNPLDEDLYESEYYESEYGDELDSLEIQAYEEGLSDYETESYGETETYDIPEPDVYLREDGAGFLVGEINGVLEFMILGSDTGEDCKSPDIDGSLIVVDVAKKTYIYEVDGCAILTVQFEQNKVILTEKKCGDIHPKNCNTWSGTYLLDEESVRQLLPPPSPYDEMFEGEAFEKHKPDIYSCNGSVFMLMKNGNNFHFMIIGEESGSCESTGVDGSLSLIDAAQNIYAYDFGGCTLLTVKLEENQAIITEKRCDGYRPKKCKTWSGTYVLDK